MLGSIIDNLDILNLFGTFKRCRRSN